MQEIYIIGAGGVGREIAAVLQKTSLKEKYKVAGFVDDAIEKNIFVNDIPVVGGIDHLLSLTEASVLIAVGNPTVRRMIIDRLESKNFDYPTIVHPTVLFYDAERIEIGKGTYISSGCILTTNIFIGNFCFLNLGVTLNHDAIIGENCVLMPGVRITCGVNLGSDSYVNANCVLSKPISITPKSRINTSI